LKSNLTLSIRKQSDLFVEAGGVLYGLLSLWATPIRFDPMSAIIQNSEHGSVIIYRLLNSAHC
jgi:hypothetical protein